MLKTCPASLSIDVGSAGFASLVATDPDSIVNGASISAGARAGISLSTFVAATSAGGDASVRLNADASVPSGVYKVDVTFTNNASQSATCSVGVSAAGTRTIPQIQGAGATSPYANTVQSSDGVITLKVASGFFMQDANGDGDSTTSDGIYVLGGVTSAGDRQQRQRLQAAAAVGGVGDRFAQQPAHGGARAAGG
ncbi:MAG: hypothetical protein H7335_12220 [Massilia sp.]|nr:hypothetical protein [Massilia sp.]